MIRTVRSCGAIASAVVAATLFAGPAWAQESGGQAEDRQMVSAELDPTYNAPYKWFVAVGFGGMSGANPIGSAIDQGAGKSFTFDLGNGGFFSVRAGKRMWWRLGAEGEFGWGSPGIEVTEQNLQGARNVMTSEFADYSAGIFSVSARLDLTDARITPFLLGGAALVFASFEGENGDESDTSAGFVFGGGVDVRIRDNINLRGDLRGLRSGIDAPLLSRGILVEDLEAGDALSTMWLWSIGVSVRFN